MSERWLWTQKEDIGPTPRRNHAMAYEAARQRVVLFGGYNSFSPQSYFGDTWEWDGDAWTQVADMGPSPRRSFDMIYDDSRQRLVLFGGDVKASTTQVNQVNGETWEWNGREWTQVADIGPPPRIGCAMAYDTLRHRVVVFGGYSFLPPQSKYFDDTWEWDGTEWTQIADTGPSARAFLPMVFDISRECLVLFGGYDGSVTLGDTWEWSEDAGWVERQEMGPQSLINPTMARTQEHTVLHGFQSGDTGAGQTWEWDGRLWTQRQDMGPSARYAPALAYDSQRDRVVLFGGSGYVPPYGYLGDTWELEIIKQ